MKKTITNLVLVLTFFFTLMNVDAQILNTSSSCLPPSGSTYSSQATITFANGTSISNVSMHAFTNCTTPPSGIMALI